jgi:hypothetical protein
MTRLPHDAGQARRSFHRTAAALVGMTLLALTTGTHPVGAVDAADRVKEDLIATRQAEYQKLREALDSPSPAALTDGQGVGPISAALTEGVDAVSDPRFDVFNGGADIVASGIRSDPGPTIVAAMIVDVYQNPLTNPDWVFGITGASWDFDVNLDGVVDYSASMFNIGGSLVGSVFDRNSNIVCPLSPFADSALAGYGVSFNASCLGNPPQFRWKSSMVYDDISLNFIEVDLAPNFGFAGPMRNPGYVAPPITPAPVAPPPASVGSPIGAGSTLELQVTGVAGVPANADAVVLNMTVVNAQAPGFATVYPCGQNRPEASNLNYTTGQTIPNLVIAKPGAGGKVCIYSYATINALADVSGFFPAGSGFTPISNPTRILDTRNGTGLGAGSTLELQVTGVAGVPADADAVVLNMTVVNAQAPGFATVYPCGQNRPEASNLNYTTGQTIPNLVIAKPGAGGKVCIYSYATINALADVSGFFPAGSGFTPISNPTRILDTRNGTGLGAGSTLELQVTGVAGVPANADAVVLNMTVVNAQAPGFATVYPCGQNRPEASNLNYTTGQTIPNLVIAKPGAGGKVCIYSYATINALADVSGFFPAGSGFTPISNPTRILDTRN